MRSPLPVLFLAVALVGCGHHTGSTLPPQPVISDGNYAANLGFPNSALSVTVSNATTAAAHFDIPSLGISVDLSPNQSVDTGTHVIGFDVQDRIDRTDTGHSLTIDGARYFLGVPG